MKKVISALLCAVLLCAVLLAAAPAALATPRYFLITSSVTGEGTVTPCEIRAVQDTTKEIEITPAEGWETAFVIVNGVNVGAVAEYSFSHIQSDIAVEVVFAQRDATWSNPYKDVKTLDWYYEAVRFVSREGLMGGSGGEFAPHEATTRAMAAMVLWRLAGSPTKAGYAIPAFTDVPAGEYYTEAVAWMVEAGIASGYGDGTFGAEDAVTRAQMITMLYRYAEKAGYGTEKADITALEDYDEIPGWAAQPAGWVLKYGIAGAGGSIDAEAPAERAQVAAMLLRFSENVPKPVKPASREGSEAMPVIELQIKLTPPIKLNMLK